MRWTQNAASDHHREVSYGHDSGPVLAEMEWLTQYWDTASINKSVSLIYSNKIWGELGWKFCSWVLVTARTIRFSTVLLDCTKSWSCPNVAHSLPSATEAMLRLCGWQSWLRHELNHTPAHALALRYSHCTHWNAHTLVNKTSLWLWKASYFRRSCLKLLARNSHSRCLWVQPLL